jgi:hypothetical protein
MLQKHGVRYIIREMGNINLEDHKHMEIHP